MHVSTQTPPPAHFTSAIDQFFFDLLLKARGSPSRNIGNDGNDNEQKRRIVIVDKGMSISIYYYIVCDLGIRAMLRILNRKLH